MQSFCGHYWGVATPKGIYLLKITGLCSCHLALIQGWPLFRGATIEAFHCTIISFALLSCLYCHCAVIMILRRSLFPILMLLRSTVLWSACWYLRGFLKHFFVFNYHKQTQTALFITLYVVTLLMNILVNDKNPNRISSPLIMWHFTVCSYSKTSLAFVGHSDWQIVGFDRPE